MLFNREVAQPPLANYLWSPAIAPLGYLGLGMSSPRVQLAGWLTFSLTMFASHHFQAPVFCYQLTRLRASRTGSMPIFASGTATRANRSTGWAVRVHELRLSCALADSSPSSSSLKLGWFSFQSDGSST